MIRILLAEDMRMLRDALEALLGLESDLDVVATVERGDLIVPAAVQHRVDVAVIDVNLPGQDGLSAVEELRRRLPSCRPLILTGMGHAGLLRRALALQVPGFLLKEAPPEELAEAIRRVADGQRVIDPQLALSAWDARGRPLTEREREVLSVAAEGADVPEIASRLHLSAGTVRNYLTSAVTKMSARNRVDAIRIARESGWIL
ncbi:response regulator transcription factor [Streptomyces sp. RB17]|uniref:response regulator transcription factor n=1 Tax=Streptomyces sp. RB17 TaxID=2585197 RepID=UPI0012971508|nr:response regulator transcription factor [Streptomyces sp. RB17]